jgi:hypothetical protein
MPPEAFASAADPGDRTVHSGDVPIGRPTPARLGAIC